MGAKTTVASRFFFLLGFVCCATFASAQVLPPVGPITGTLLEFLTIIGDEEFTGTDRVERNQLFRGRLDVTGIPNQWLPTRCGHWLRCNYADGGAEIFEFVRNHIEIADIDMNPGSDRNTINLKSKGLIPVAILTDAYFDAGTEIDPSPDAIADFGFGPDNATPAHRGHTGDVDGDGDLDVILHFRVQETGIESGDVQACLSGATRTGVPIRACEVIVTK